MKKIFASIFVVMLFCTMLPISASAYQENISGEFNVAEVSAIDILTFEEMVSRYAESGGISYSEALAHFPAPKSMRSTIYSVFDVQFDVTPSYKPRLEFYCEVSIGDGVFGIMSIYSVQLVREYKNTSKQFNGDIDVWLRGPYKIEYVINGDFYNNGTTTVTDGGSGNFGIDELIGISFSSSITTSSNHYKYFYEHETAVFNSL